MFGLLSVHSTLGTTQPLFPLAHISLKLNVQFYTLPADVTDWQPDSFMHLEVQGKGQGTAN